MKILFRAHFHQKKNFLKKVGRKFIRVRIRIQTFLKVGSGSGKNRPDPQHCSVVSTEPYLAERVVRRFETQYGAWSHHRQCELRE
jgi:hypothetical protein